MKSALLVCDHVPAHLVAEHGTYPGMFNSVFDMPLDPFYVCDGNFPPLGDYDAFICTGSRFSVYDDINWIHQLKEFTRKAFEEDKTYVGICFGHQMIAHSLGGKVAKAEHGFLVGIHTFSIQKKESWMVPYQPQYDVVMLCQDQVTKLPPGATLLAASGECPIGMFSVGGRFLAIQGHPEFSAAYNRALFKERLKPSETEKRTAALRSFESKIADKTLLSGYLNRFLKEG